MSRDMAVRVATRFLYAGMELDQIRQELERIADYLQQESTRAAQSSKEWERKAKKEPHPGRDIAMRNWGGFAAEATAYRDARSEILQLLAKTKTASPRGRERNQNGTHVVVRDVAGLTAYLNNTESGGWTPHEYLAVPMPQARAEELARKFHAEAIPRPKPIIHNRPVSV